MLGHRERHLVPYELDHEHDGGAGWPDWQPGRPGHWQEARGLSTESRSAGETGEQIVQAALCLQKQQRYESFLLSFSLFLFFFSMLKTIGIYRCLLDGGFPSFN